MNKLIGIALVAALMVPAAVQAAEKGGTVKNWFAATRNVILADGTECYLGADVKEVPATLAVGKDVTLTYTAAGAPPVNTCSAIVVK